MVIPLPDDETTPLLSQYDETINEKDDVQVILDEFSSNLINIESIESNELTDLEVERLSNLYKERLKNLDVTIPDPSMCLLKDVSTYVSQKYFYATMSSKLKQDQSKFDHKRSQSTEKKNHADPKNKIIKLITKHGILNIVQENGQRKLGPFPGWTGPPPNPECEVYVGNIPREVFEDEMYPLFASIGEIFQIRLITSFAGFNRGYGFVMYSNVEYANKAISELTGYELRPCKKIAVVKSINNCRLCINSLPENLNVQEFIDVRIF
ncbi:probable RNA-binding protein 46 [Chelonus insularis]|uniref:probable RNA-binding protein 46 n=1 Tax=Chelonus insularis TaxID=460826 RepID=UPI00158E6ABF|nr:probable RNA-binding protein 46 [Chelonus insularis]